MKAVLFRLIYLVLRLLRPRRRPSAARTVLVLQYQMPLGCCVHGTPLYAALKEGGPGATVIVATRGLGAAVLQHDPHVDHLLVTDDPMASLAGMWRVAQALRGQLRGRGLQPDLVLQDGSSKAGSFALFAAMLRLAPTAGFANAPQLYDRHYAYDWERSLIDNNLRLAEDGPHREPAVYFTAADVAAARALLAKVDAETQPRTAFVMQGSGGQRTGWHDERFAAVIGHVEALGHATVFLGTAADAANIERIRSLAGSKGQSLAGRTTVPQLAALLCLCDLLVSVDTGTMHVGRAADVPMVVLGPSWQRPLEWLPLGKANVRVLRGEDRATVPPAYRLDEIAVEQVIAAVDELRRVYPASAQGREERVARLVSATRA
jgi:ADP-heptose:LPS heptosyltransferase